MNSSATLLDVITNVLIIKLEEESLSKLLELPLDVEPLLTIFNIGDDLTCVEATSSVELMHFKVVLNTKESTNGFLIFNKYSISHVETIFSSKNTLFLDITKRVNFINSTLETEETIPLFKITSKSLPVCSTFVVQVE